MIEEMIESGQYQEALAKLTDMSDERTRYWRLVCLYALGEYTRGLEEAKAAKLLAKDTYYDVLAYYVGFLKENEQYEQAIDTLVEELSMPYLPYAYEGTLNALYDEILLLKQEAYADYERQKKILSDQELRLYLTKGISDDLANLALEELAGKNIRHYLPEIRQFFKNPERSSIEKSLLLEILKEQEVDEYLEMTKHHHTIEVNPLYLEDVLGSLTYEHVGQLLSKVIEQDNPSLFEMCLDFLEWFLYDWYPMLETIESEEALAAVIHYYLATLNGIEEDQEDLCYRYGADFDSFKALFANVENFQGI